MRILVVFWLVLSVAHADTIAMLPLDTEKRLEIYSQPVAAEIARALKAAGVDVVVVDAKMEVPENVRLIVDGTIKAGKGKEVTVAIRIRDPRDGTTLDNVPPQTAPLANIDKAAAEVSAHVVPLVQSHLAELAKAKAVEPPPKVVEPLRPQAPLAPLVMASVTARTDYWGKALAPLRDALGSQLVGWAHEEQHEAKLVPAEQLARKTAVKTIGDNHAEAGITFEVLTFVIYPEKPVPMAWARVRVRIYSGAELKFDRIVRTDSVVGDRGMTKDALAARTARAVLAILSPNVRRTLAVWKK